MIKSVYAALAVCKSVYLCRWRRPLARAQTSIMRGCFYCQEIEPVRDDCSEETEESVGDDVSRIEDADDNEW